MYMPFSVKILTVPDISSSVDHQELHRGYPNYVLHAQFLQDISLSSKLAHIIFARNLNVASMQGSAPGKPMESGSDSILKAQAIRKNSMMVAVNVFLSTKQKPKTGLK